MSRTGEGAPPAAKGATRVVRAVARGTSRFLLRRVGFGDGRLQEEVEAGRARWSSLLLAVAEQLGRRRDRASESFEEARRVALAENGWSDAQFEANAKSLRALYTKRLRAFTLIAALSVAYALFVLIRTEQWLSFAAIIVWSAFLALLAMHAAFRRWQIESRNLGTINEWLLER